MGGLQVLLALKVLENAALQKGEHPSSSVDTLEVLMRVWRAVSQEYWLYDVNTLDNEDQVAAYLSEANAARIWARAQENLSEPARAYLGSHSQTLTIIDENGNAITGINTIQSFPWGDGVFVRGVALPNSGKLVLPGSPGRRRLDTVAMNIVTQNRALYGAGTTFGFSLREAAFQMWVNTIDLGLSIGAALAEPRFGTFVMLPDGTTDMSTQYLDPRVPTAIGLELRARGVGVTQVSVDGFFDIGLGTAASTEGDLPTSAYMSMEWVDGFTESY